MTRRSILEYAQALRSRYFGASRAERGKMLDEFTQVTGLYRPSRFAIFQLILPGMPTAAHWVASDTLKGLESEAVQTRLKR